MSSKKYFLKYNYADYWERSPSNVWLPWFDDLIAALDLRSKETLLDLGAGNGRFAIPFLKKGVRYIGLDISRSALLDARRKTSSETDCDWVVGDCGYLPFKKKSVNKVFCFATMVYVPDQSLAIKEVSRILKDGGHFVVSLTNLLDKYSFCNYLYCKVYYFLKRLSSPFSRLSTFVLGRVILQKLKIALGGAYFFKEHPWYPKLFFRIHKILRKNGLNIVNRFYITRVPSSDPNVGYALVESARLLSRWFCAGEVLKLQRICEAKNQGTSARFR